MKKFKTYNGETLHNATVSYKIDGVRAHRTDNGIVSRKDKPLYNIAMSCDVAEVFAGSWEQTVSLVRTQSERHIPPEFVYSILPALDARLYVSSYDILEPYQVDSLFQHAKDLGYEGLVIETDRCYYKVKSVETYDALILGVQEGTGKHKGRLGAFITSFGKVGTGFTDKQREEMFTEELVGETVEVEVMGLTPQGMFRHPRFVRIRFDKDAV
jgi:hypothetical protein